LQPPQAAGWASLLAAPGTTSKALLATVERMTEVHRQVAALCGEWVRARE
jgi:hypothetical protein